MISQLNNLLSKDKNMKAVDDSDYNMHAFEWGREWI